MNLLPSTLIFLPSLLVAVPMPLDQEGSTYIRGYNYKVSDAPIDQSIYESHENHLQLPRSDGSRINFSRYYDSPGLPQHVAPPLDAVVVEAKVFVKVVTYICQSCYMYLSKGHERHGKAVVFPSSDVNDNTNCLGYSMLGCVWEIYRSFLYWRQLVVLLSIYLDW